MFFITDSTIVLLHFSQGRSTFISWWIAWFFCHHSLMLQGCPCQQFFSSLTLEFSVYRILSFDLWCQKKSINVSGIAAGWRSFLMNRPHCLSVIFFTFNEYMSLLVIMVFLARLILKKNFYINGGLLKQLLPTEKEKKIHKDIFSQFNIHYFYTTLRLCVYYSLEPALIIL